MARTGRHHLRPVAVAAVAVAAALALVTPAAGDGRDRVPTPGRATVLARGLDDVGDIAVKNMTTAALAPRPFADPPSTVDLLRRGVRTPVVTVPDTPFTEWVDALTWDGRRLLFALTLDQRGEEDSWLQSWDRRRGVRRLAGLGESGYEGVHNPDAVTTYGFVDLPAECAEQFLHENPFERHETTYRGDQDSFPVATAVSRGTVFVLDREANDLLAVEPDGVRTVTVLPPVVAPVTAGSRTQQDDMPACALGRTYVFEPFPADLERGHDGWLYVTVPSESYNSSDLRPLGSVVRVHPRTGQVRTVVDRLVGPTQLEIGPAGELYVGVHTGVVVVPRWSSTAHPFLPSGEPVGIRGRTLVVRDGGTLLRVPIRRG